jgi:uncharacterized membrane protein
METREAPLRERYVVPGVLAASAVLLVGLAVQSRRGPHIRKRRPDIPSLTEGRGVHLERTVTILRPLDEVYRTWRDLDRLPALMPAVESVQVTSPTRSRWRVRGPGGRVATWEAEIVGDRENELIAWRSLPGSAFEIAGSVHFRAAPGNRGTEVKAIVAFSPRGRRLGGLLARLTDAGDRELRQALRRFKQVLEAGESPTVEGQPSGRAAGGWVRRRAS